MGQEQAADVPIGPRQPERNAAFVCLVGKAFDHICAGGIEKWNGGEIYDQCLVAILNAVENRADGGVAPKNRTPVMR